MTRTQTMMASLMVVALATLFTATMAAGVEVQSEVYTTFQIQPDGSADIQMRAILPPSGVYGPDWRQVDARNILRDAVVERVTLGLQRVSTDYLEADRSVHVSAWSPAFALFRNGRYEIDIPGRATIVQNEAGSVVAVHHRTAPDGSLITFINRYIFPAGSFFDSYDLTTGVMAYRLQNAVLEDWRTIKMAPVTVVERPPLGTAIVEPGPVVVEETLAPTPVVIDSVTAAPVVVETMSPPEVVETITAAPPVYVETVPAAPVVVARAVPPSAGLTGHWAHRSEANEVLPPGVSSIFLDIGTDGAAYNGNVVLEHRTLGLPVTVLRITECRQVGDNVYLKARLYGMDSGVPTDIHFDFSGKKMGDVIRGSVKFTQDTMKDKTRVSNHDLAFYRAI